MADPKVVREWLDKADEDFNFARINLEERKEHMGSNLRKEHMGSNLDSLLKN